MKPLLTIPIILLLTSCSQCPINQPSQTADTTVITTRVGEVFQITLHSNPTTGYRWRLGEDGAEGMVKLIGSEFVAPDTQRLGAGGLEVWTFRGVKPGKTILPFEYARPWEKGVEPKKTVRYEVGVE